MVRPRRSANDLMSAWTKNSFMPLSPPETMTTSCLATSIMATALSTAECTTSNLPAARPSRWLREFSVRWSSILKPRCSKTPLAMPACSGSALALGNALTRSSVGSCARVGFVARESPNASAMHHGHVAIVPESMNSSSCNPAQRRSIPPVAPSDPLVDRRQLAGLELRVELDRCFRPRGDGAPAGRRVHRREARELAGACRIAEHLHEVGDEIVAERRALLGAQRREIPFHEGPGEIRLLAGRRHRIDDAFNERARQLVGQREVERLARERRIARARGGGVIALALHRIGRLARQRKQRV